MGCVSQGATVKKGNGTGGIATVRLAAPTLCSPMTCAIPSVRTQFVPGTTSNA